MTIETGLLSRVSPICANVFPGIAPKDPPLPCVVYNRINTTPISDLNPGTGTAWIYLQIDTYSLRYLEARSVADAIRPVLEQWKDANIQAVSWVAESEDMDTSTEQDIHTVKSRYVILLNL